MQRIPCDLSSTISTGSFLTTETLDVSPVDTGKCLGCSCERKIVYSLCFIAEWV